MEDTEIIELENVTFHIHQISDGDFQLITEGKVKGDHLVGTYSTMKDQPHNSTGQYHIHLYNKGNQVLAINKDGSGHDGYTGTRIPNKAYKALKAKYTDWVWPSDKIVETTNYTFINHNPRAGLRPVTVTQYQELNISKGGFNGYLHCFGNDLISVAGGGTKEKLIAIVETEYGSVVKVQANTIKFTDI